LTRYSNPMNEKVLFEITKQELGTLKEFLRVLKEERDAIISFSLEGIIRENNRKEELLKRLEYLESEKEAFLSKTPDPEVMAGSDSLRSLRSDIQRIMGEVKIALEKNMKLLSFSMDHVKSSIENIISFLNRTTYSHKKEKLSVMLSREI